MIVLIALAGRIVLAWILLVAGLPKLRDVSAFRDSVAGYRLLPRRAVAAVAVAVPAVEVATGLALAFGIYPAAASVVAASLFGLFGIVVAVTVLRRLRIHCGCSADNRVVSWPLVLQDVALVGLAAYVAAAATSDASLWAPNVSPPIMARGDAVAGVLLGALLPSAWRALNAVRQLWRLGGSLARRNLTVVRSPH